MAGEGVFPKSPSDILYASEVNDFNTHGTGDGSDHANVATNDTHVAGDGSDHSLLANKTSYWSCAGNAFRRQQETVLYNANEGTVAANTNAVYFMAQVSLPNGAIVTGAIVYGDPSASAETWTLRRIALSSATVTTLATANIETEDVTINNATIDNSTYGYFIDTSTLDTGDTIRGARITYTTDYT